MSKWSESDVCVSVCCLCCISVWIGALHQTRKVR